MSQTRQPAGIPTGGQFAPQGRGRADAVLNQIGIDDAHGQYRRALSAYRSRSEQFDVALRFGRSIGAQINAMATRRTAYADLVRRAGSVGEQTPPAPIDPPHLLEAERERKSLREIVGGHDGDGRFDDARRSAARSVLSHLDHDEFEARLNRIEFTRRALHHFETVEDPAFALGADPEKFLDLVDPEDYRDADGLDYGRMAEDLATEWSDRHHALVNETFEADWRLRK